MEELEELVGQKVIYSSAGGLGSILLLTVENDNSIWTWGYWEIWREDELLGTAYDDNTPNTGKMAVATHQLLGKEVQYVRMDEARNLEVLFEDGLQLYVYVEEEGIEDPIEERWEYWIPRLDKVYVVMINKEIKIGKYYEYNESYETISEL